MGRHRRDGRAAPYRFSQECGEKQEVYGQGKPASSELSEVEVSCRMPSGSVHFLIDVTGYYE